MTLYTDLVAAIASTETGFSAHVSDDWKQGRTTYGGLSGALCVEAALRAFPEAPPLRSAQFAFVGPAAGELAISVRPLRQGKSTLFVAVDLIGEQGVATHGVLTFGAARTSALSYEEVLCPPVAPAKSPLRTVFFSYAVCKGPPPLPVPLPPTLLIPPSLSSDPLPPNPGPFFAITIAAAPQVARTVGCIHAHSMVAHTLGEARLTPPFFLVFLEAHRNPITA